MDTEERNALLGAGGTGVISLSTGEGESPHSIPVSYGFDATEDSFYFRLAADTESTKGDLDGRAVSFVTYARRDDVWQSVVATGTLEPTTDEEIATETLAGLDRVDIPYVDIFGEPIAEVPFEFYRLVPTEFTGRKEDPVP